MDSEIYLVALSVHPKYHSKGYGTLILNYLSSNLKTEGYKIIKLMDEKKATRFFSK